MLERVAAEGTRLRDPARVTLTVIYVREDQPDRAAMLLEELETRFSRNYLLPQNRAFALGRARRWEAATEVYATLLPRVEAGQENFHLADPLSLRLHWGHAAVQAGRGRLARDVYGRLLRQDRTPDWARTMAHLGRGRAHDLTGDREAAVTDYRAVLGGPDVDDAHDRADAHLDRPYRAE